jgi:hypothetical protein
LDVSKFLRVTERSVWRWLSDDSAPFAVLAALWHETPQGREASHLDVGNALVIERGLARSRGDALAAADGLLARVVAIADFGCANDPLYVGPVPRSVVDAFALSNVYHKDNQYQFFEPENNPVRPNVQPVPSL